MRWIIIVVAPLLLGFFVLQYALINAPMTPRALKWGDRRESNAIRVFRLQTLEKGQMAALKERLEPFEKRLGFSSSMFSTADDWSWGLNRTWFEKSFLAHWRSHFDWNAAVRGINRFPQFTTDILGLRIHFWHLKAKDEEAPVVLLLHGWPGSVWEFHDVVERLTGAHHIVVPSLPGFGWSDASTVPGLCPVEIGHIFTLLMARLGYSKYYIQGGDYGSFVAQSMSRLSPGAVRGMVLNMFPVSGLRSLLGTPRLLLWGSSDERSKIFPLSAYLHSIFQETGYLHLQGTKPHSLGVAMSDSPLGLAAWIMEKFAAWTDRKAGALELSDVIRMDDLITNVMIYITTNTAQSSMRLYKETVSSSNFRQLMGETIPARVVLLDFPREILPPPQQWVEAKFTNIARFVKVNTGGHFAALEQPEVIASEVKLFIAEEERKRAHINDFLKDWVRQENAQEEAIKMQQMEQQASATASKAGEF